MIFGKNAINKYDTTTIAKIHKPKPTEPFLRILAGTLFEIHSEKLERGLKACKEKRKEIINIFDFGCFVVKTIPNNMKIV